MFQLRREVFNLIGRKDINVPRKISYGTKGCTMLNLINIYSYNLISQFKDVELIHFEYILKLVTYITSTAQ